MPNKAPNHGNGHDPATADLLDVLADAEAPVFATDDEQRVTFWNRGAESLFGRDPAEAIGRTCWEIVRGRDPFGNRFCYRECPVMATSRRGEVVSGCEFLVPLALEADQLQPVAVTLLPIAGRRRQTAPGMLHILCPLGTASRHRAEPVDEGASAEDPHLGREPVVGGTLVLVAGGPAGADGRAKGNGKGEGSPAGDHADGKGNGRPAPEPPLTARETEILRWVATGLQNKEVAQKLGISLATVRNHIHSILDKLDVHSKLEAVSLAFRHGWVSGEVASHVGGPAPRSSERQRRWVGTA